MAAIGHALGCDPGFVALHHFARIAALIVIVPVLPRVAARRDRKNFPLMA